MGEPRERGAASHLRSALTCLFFQALNATPQPVELVMRDGKPPDQPLRQYDPHRLRGTCGIPSPVAQAAPEPLERSPLADPTQRLRETRPLQHEAGALTHRR